MGVLVTKRGEKKVGGVTVLIVERYFVNGFFFCAMA